MEKEVGAFLYDSFEEKEGSNTSQDFDLVGSSIDHSEMVPSQKQLGT